jgi:Putative auto-transporter adhesin, head GIN domain
MKKILIMLLAAATMLNFYSCKKVVGEGPMQTENRSIDNFNSVTANIDGNIYFTQSPNYKVEIKAQRNIIDIIETYKSGNGLIIKFRNNLYAGRRTDIVINISAPSLESFHLNGPGDAYVTGNFTAQQFNTNVSGSGNLTADNLQIANTLTAQVSGSGNIRGVTGFAKTTKITVSGSGNIDFTGLKADNVEARISGSGNTKVYAVQTLDASISGSGIVYYSGNPSISTRISGSGKVIKM